MILSTLVSRSTFLGGLVSSSLSIGTMPDISAPTHAAAAAAAAQYHPPALADVSSFITSYLCPNVLNVPQSSSTSLNMQELEAQRKAAACIVRETTITYLRSDPTLAGPILRMAFHDAATREELNADSHAPTKFSGGPNGSIRYEVGWSENRGLSRPLGVAEDVYSRVRGMELSFADTVALMGAASVEYAGGPQIDIKLGRADADKADPKRRRRPLQNDTERSLVETTLPSAGLDSNGLRLFFRSLGLSEEEFVALCGAHDLGRHVTLLNMPKDCLKDLTRQCLEEAPVLLPFVSEGPDTLSNVYFQKLLKWNDRRVKLGEVAFIPTDVDLVVDEGLRVYVQKFARDEKAFFDNFSTAYKKLVDVSATSELTY